jgi:hypothetical protein
MGHAVDPLAVYLDAIVAITAAVPSSCLMLELGFAPPERARASLDVTVKAAYAVLSLPHYALSALVLVGAGFAEKIANFPSPAEDAHGYRLLFDLRRFRESDCLQGNSSNGTIIQAAGCSSNASYGRRCDRIEGSRS